MHDYRLLFPGGRPKAFTLSFDDGVLQDIGLIEILNRYGLKCTFNLNSGFFGQQDTLLRSGKTVNHAHVEAARAAQVYRGHEVAVHTVTHPRLEQIPPALAAYEILQDRRALESAVGYPVRGMAYPFGTYDRKVMEVAGDAGVEYSRTTRSTYDFSLPQTFLDWAPTCHYNAPELDALTEQFLSLPENKGPGLFYVWGHSYELDQFDNWDRMEGFCRWMSGHDSVWYATNIEIVDYLKASRRLRFSADGTLVWNPSACPVFFFSDEKVTAVAPGETKKI